MKTIIKLTVAAALTAVTFHAWSQDDALAQLRARRATPSPQAELDEWRRLQSGIAPLKPKKR